jgi:DNA-binding transcriptional LysR family regulator
VNPPAVSHQLKTFEARLGVALFLRSTRTVTLTEAGRTLLEDCRHLLGTLDQALGRARDASQARAGRLRITLPFRAWQTILAPRFAAFHTAHPGIELDLAVEESLTDIIGQGFHAGIRLGDHLQDGMIALRLTAAEPAAYVASPEYLARHGKPLLPADLLAHTCIRHRQVSSGRISDWRFAGPDGERTVAVGGPLIVNDLRSVVDCVRRGVGIGWSLKRGVQDELDRGDLVQVLEDVTPARPGFFLYFPKAAQQLGLLRAFIDHFRP